MLNPFIFREARKQHGINTSVDLFASADHHQLPRYLGQYDDRMAAGTDAFYIDWNTEEKPYANPPWPLLSIVLEKVAHGKVKILMVAPDWPEAEW